MTAQEKFMDTIFMLAAAVIILLALHLLEPGARARRRPPAL
jgi:hypothetical protein